jgi:hypothetical protein
MLFVFRSLYFCCHCTTGVNVSLERESFCSSCDNHLLDKYIAIEKELILVRNQSSELSTKLGKVNNVKLEQDMHSLQQQVKSIGIKTYLLVSNDRNRNRDIAALYNKNDFQKNI